MKKELFDFDKLIDECRNDKIKSNIELVKNACAKAEDQIKAQIQMQPLWREWKCYVDKFPGESTKSTFDLIKLYKDEFTTMEVELVDPSCATPSVKFSISKPLNLTVIG